MKKMVPAVVLLSFAFGGMYAQEPLPPDKIYGELFKDVQLARIFPDNKTFVDCVPKRDPKEIVKDYLAVKNNPAVRFALDLFIKENFEIPASPTEKYKTPANEDVVTHINKLWKVLRREQDKPVEGSSLLPLPYPYIVPGGRFREIYYWDSYFTMLGLKESGETDMIENMVNNFSYLIATYGHIPNGNRTYYLSRSQPPYFALMVDLLASAKGRQILALHLNSMQKEYDYWMDKTAPTKHVVKMPDGSILNRYYDQSDQPRQESYYEDHNLSKNLSEEKRGEMNRNLRSAAESGWDFSSRWFEDSKNLKTIQVTDMIPVDLNSLLYSLEKTLAKAYRETGNLIKERYYDQLAEKRKEAINKYCWSSAKGWYVDYNLVKQKPSDELTIACMSPFFSHLAPKERMSIVAKQLEQKFVKDGGVLTTLKNTGEQWDAPNGWAPLEWITIMGLENYDQHELAEKIAKRWVDLNVNIFNKAGKLMEKYNVADTHLEAGGGEYPGQDGFGWTNGVLLALIKKYHFNE